MVKYNKNTQKFESTYKVFSLEEVTPNIMYGWINQKLISIADFKVYLSMLNGVKPS